MSGDPRRVGGGPTRRAVLAAAAAGVVAPLLSRGAAARTSAIRVGAIELTVVSDGDLVVPLSFSVPDAPRDELSAVMTAHGFPAEGRPNPVNPTLVRTGGELILIDAGTGPGFQEAAGKLPDHLAAAGIKPERITKVVLTHAHADHLWGVIDEMDDERFPNASYVIAAAEWDYWMDPATPSKVPDWLQGMAAGTQRRLKRIEAKVERKRPGDLVGPGLAYVDLSGHTPGHMGVLVESGRERLMIVGDALPHAAIAFARPGWRLTADVDHDRAAATRRRLLEQLSLDEMPIIGFHLPFPGHGHVERAGDAFRFRAA
jgi:glyoxylase-like metal-dependent hydrolase (beta-lactamase superfamily II)